MASEKRRKHLLSKLCLVLLNIKKNRTKPKTVLDFSKLSFDHFKKILIWIKKLNYIAVKYHFWPSPKCFGFVQNVLDLQKGRDIRVMCPFTGPKMFCAGTKTNFTECKSSFGLAQNVCDWHNM